ncbi:MAG: indole-3-glycerol-phosphate synthase [Methanosarcinaceae archaeon]|nr:indole-3-glycerol-phosphate synthase [Methanosarcinaceae archaeon]MDF1533763.1 indole-3-glycerol-phosphate synthase [Methanosarcinaceae archaeon]
MHRVIEDILKATKKRVATLDISNNDATFQNTMHQKRDFISAVKLAKQEGKIPIIAEVKPASPSATFREILPDDAAEIAKEMERGGAVAISVLTEPDFFNGSIDNLKSARNSISIPVLRKDFIIDEIQMDEAKSDLILLIAGALGDKLGSFVLLAQSKGFEPLVEIHNEDELNSALKTTAKVIGINNRDLGTLEVDLQTTVCLAPIIRDFDNKNGTKHIIISESGVHNKDDINRVICAGADAILIGTAIIKSSDVYTKTKEMVDALI